MIRSLRKWLCMVAAIWAPAWASALPPEKALHKSAAVGLEARCPLADGTWQLDQIFNQMSATRILSQPSTLETHDVSPSTIVFHPDDLPESVQQPAEVAAKGAKHKRVNEEYLPYDLRTDDCLRYQRFPNAGWIRSNLSSSVHENAVALPTRAERCMVFDEDLGALEDVVQDEVRVEAEKNLRSMISVWKRGVIQRDAQWIFNRAVAEYAQQIVQIQTLGGYPAVAESDETDPFFELKWAIASASEQVPSVCTPPPADLLTPAIKHPESSLSAETLLAGDPPSWGEVAGISLDAAALQLDAAANLLRQAGQMVSGKTTVASKPSGQRRR